MNDLTREWLELFDADVAAGKEPAASVFWRLALHSLPAGVDRDHPRVVDALKTIRESVARRDEKGRT